MPNVELGPKTVGEVGCRVSSNRVEGKYVFGGGSLARRSSPVVSRGGGDPVCEDSPALESEAFLPLPGRFLKLNYLKIVNLRQLERT